VIAVTQPRRVAATSLAARVAAERHVPLGTLVGYSVRFDEASSQQTRIKYLTDGMIIRELLFSPLLSQYSVIVVDEAHERTLRTDLLLSNLKRIQQSREGKNPLKIVIMSATLDAEKVSTFFNGYLYIFCFFKRTIGYNFLSAKIIYVKGRQHPVVIFHTAESQPDYIDAALRTFFQVHTVQPPGDVLIFLPGRHFVSQLLISI
jgi:HrpA-like RNA helicase